MLKINVENFSLDTKMLSRTNILLQVFTYHHLLVVSSIQSPFKVVPFKVKQESILLLCVLFMPLVTFIMSLCRVNSPRYSATKDPLSIWPQANTPRPSTPKFTQLCQVQQSKSGLQFAFDQQLTKDIQNTQTWALIVEKPWCMNACVHG